MAREPINRGEIDALNNEPRQADNDPYVSSDTDFDALSDFDEESAEADVATEEEKPSGDTQGDLEAGPGKGKEEVSSEEEAGKETPKADAPSEEVDSESKPDAKAPEEPKKEDEEAKPDAEAKPEQQEPQKPQLTPEQAMAARQEWLTQSSRQLADTEFALSEEEIAQLQQEPEKVLPLMAGKATVIAIEAATHTVLSELPRVIQNTIAQTHVAERDKDDFFEKWPALNDPKYMPKVHEVGLAFRQTNPNASKDDFIQQVGVMASVMLGLPLNLPEGDQANAEAVAAAAAAAAEATKPTKPAARTPTAAAPAKEPENEFAELAVTDFD